MEPKGHPDRTPTFEWDLAHRMSDIGNGYLWPNIAISCDGLQCELAAERSDDSDTPLFYYLGSNTTIVPAQELETAIDSFAGEIISWLEESRVHNTNLQTLWAELREERQDPEAARVRRIEALLGLDPDDVDSNSIEQWLLDAASLGENAIAELATGSLNNMLPARQIQEISNSEGFKIESDDGFRLEQTLATQSGSSNPQWGNMAAWRIGVATANEVRQQASLNNHPISDGMLAALTGTSKEAVISDKRTKSVSWQLEYRGNESRIALRPWVHTARRFDIARLLGDRLFRERGLTPDEPLSPATLSYSYRQKAQRAFAAQLLSPWEAVNERLEEDYSQENREQVAQHFKVSPLTIDNLIRNNQIPGGAFS